MAMTPDHPEGFEPHFRRSALTEPWEPLCSRREPGKIVIGVRAREAHCNSRGLVHGGLIVALADNAMGLSCVQKMMDAGEAPEGGLVTVSIAADFVSAARLGQWLAFDTTYVRTGRALCFAQAFVTADGEVIARTDARFSLRPGKQG
jgi:uncharacterized protein (TIGR00369 family)